MMKNSKKSTAKNNIEEILEAGYKYPELLARSRTACNTFADLKKHIYKSTLIVSASAKVPQPEMV